MFAYKVFWPALPVGKRRLSFFAISTASQREKQRNS